jgi:outer membrane lipoprotein-sorting protein
MKKINVLLILLSLVFSGFAQKEPEAKELFDQVSKKALAYKNIHAKFEYLYENKAENKSETYNGELYIKGKKFKIDVDKTITFCDGKNRWVYLTESNEATITKVESKPDDAPEDRFLNDPLSLFLLYREGFKYRLDEPETIENKTYQVAELSPEDIKKPYFKIRYWFTQSNDLYMVKYFQKDGTRLTLTFTGIGTNEKPDESFFTFDEKKYKDVEIIDMRE